MNNDQAGRTYGNAWMFGMLIKLLKHTNIHILYAFMAIFVIPVTLIFSPGARLTYRYFHEKRGHGRFKSILETYRNHIIFGQTVIDKFAMYAGHQFTIHYQGMEEYEKLTKQTGPLIQLSAHIGCSEIVGYSYDNAKPLNVLVYGGEKESVMTYRQSAFGNKKIKMIPVGVEESHSDEIINALDNGEIIYAFADRFVNSDKIIYETLYGNSVRLARGPFSLAVTRGLNVVMTSAMKEKDGSYTTYLTPLSYDKTLTKREQRKQLAHLYMEEVEKLLDRYPLQWFNYSDLWADNEIII